jgi:hypothetical protein
VLNEPAAAVSVGRWRDFMGTSPPMRLSRRRSRSVVGDLAEAGLESPALASPLLS